MMSSLVRPALMFAAILPGFSCGDPVQPTEVLGYYDQVAIDGQELPVLAVDVYAAGCVGDAIGGSLVIESERFDLVTLTRVRCPNDPPRTTSKRVVGSITISGKTLSFESEIPDGAIDIEFGTLDGGAIDVHVVSSGDAHVLRFERNV